MAYNPYGGFGGGYPAPPAAVSPEVQRMFDAVDRDKSGKINSSELKIALINGSGDHFSDAACNLMIGMFDADKSGTIDIKEFEQLFAYINQWLQCFRTYDRDQSGHIDESELYQALTTMGYRFSPEFVKFLVGRCDPQTHAKVDVDKFILLCVQIQRFTDAFRVRDTEMKGVITIAYEDFLTVALSASN